MILTATEVRAAHNRLQHATSARSDFMLLVGSCTLLEYKGVYLKGKLFLFVFWTSTGSTNSLTGSAGTFAA
jgi:hypothetical protein